MKKTNLQNIELSVFENFKLQKDFPSWLKIAGVVLGLLVILSFLSLFSNLSMNSNNVVKEKMTPTPTIVEQNQEISDNRKEWRSIKTKLEDHDPLQKDLLPPEIELEIKFEQ